MIKVVGSLLKPPTYHRPRLDETTRKTKGVWERGYKGIIRVYTYIYIYYIYYVINIVKYSQQSSGYSDHRNNNGEFPNRFFPVGSCHFQAQKSIRCFTKHDQPTVSTVPLFEWRVHWTVGLCGTTPRSLFSCWWMITLCPEKIMPHRPSIVSQWSVW